MVPSDSRDSRVLSLRAWRLPKRPDLPLLPALGTPTAVHHSESAIRLGSWLFVKPLGTVSIFLQAGF